MRTKMITFNTYKYSTTYFKNYFEQRHCSTKTKSLGTEKFREIEQLNYKKIYKSSLRNRKINPEYALKLLHIAAEKHPQAQNDLGMLYYNGWIVERNMERGLDYLQKAVFSNCPDAAMNLGGIEEVKSTPTSMKTALKYFELAKKFGHPYADEAIFRVSLDQFEVNAYYYGPACRMNGE